MSRTPGFRGGMKQHTIVNADEDTLEGMNNSLADGLSSKVSQLKSLAWDLDAEARDHLPLLDGMTEEMESGKFRLGGTSGRLWNLSRSTAGRRYTCYVGLGVAMFLVFVYYFILPSGNKE